MTREVPRWSATSWADAGPSRSRAATASRVGAATPLGSAGGRGGAQRGERPVDLLLAAGLLPAEQLLAVARVLLEPLAQRGERERLQQVLDDPLRHRGPHHREVARRGHRQHVGGVARGAHRAHDVEPVPVGQVHVEQHEVDRVGLAQGADGVCGGAGGADHDETGHPADVRGVGVGRDRLVLDHEHPDRRSRRLGSHAAAGTVRPRRGRAQRDPDGEGGAVGPVDLDHPAGAVHDLPDQGQAEAAALRAVAAAAWSTSRARTPAGRRPRRARDRCRPPARAARRRRLVTSTRTCCSPTRAPSPATASSALSTRLPSTVTRSRGGQAGGVEGVLVDRRAVLDDQVDAALGGHRRLAEQQRGHDRLARPRRPGCR